MEKLTSKNYKTREGIRRLVERCFKGAPHERRLRKGEKMALVHYIKSCEGGHQPKRLVNTKRREITLRVLKLLLADKFQEAYEYYVEEGYPRYLADIQVDIGELKPKA